MSNANQSDFRASWNARQRRNARLGKLRYEQALTRSAFGAPKLSLPPQRSAEFVEGLDPLYEGEVER